MGRLRQWCEDANAAEETDGNKQRYDFAFVDQSSFEQHQPKTFAALTSSFTDYKD
jgi:hypothetical protein